LRRRLRPFDRRPTDRGEVRFRFQTEVRSDSGFDFQKTGAGFCGSPAAAQGIFFNEYHPCYPCDASHSAQAVAAIRFGDFVRHLNSRHQGRSIDTRGPPADSRALMKNPDDQDIDPDDIFEELEPAEPESLDARVRNGEEVDIDELTEELIADLDWDEILEADRNYVDYLEEKKPKPPKPPEQP